MPGDPPQVDSSRRHVAFGLAAVAVRGARRATTAALAPAGAIWRSASLSPARRTIEREIAGIAAQGRREELDLQGRLEAELERLIAAALDSPATDRIVQRVLQSPGVERAIVTVLESELLLESTERALRSEEIGLVLAWIADSPEIRRAVFQQSAGLADVVEEEVRARSANADDAAERFARALLRRPPRRDDRPPP
jgi:hypothetical protein